MKKNDQFFEKVYEITRLIPCGRVTTYGAIAKYIGSPQSARIVGWALNNSHSFPEFVPAHRVINRNGVLTGKHHFRHENMMKELLESEGVTVKNDVVTDFKKLYWDPCKELD